MQYILLIYGNEAANASAMAKVPPAEAYAPWITYTEALKSAGAFRAGDPLAPVATASTVRMRDGKRQVQDGPFAETKEQLGGYYIIEAANLDEALTWAAKCPGALYGSMEVRPVGMM